MENPIWSIVWFLVLIFISFWVAFFFAPWYIILYAITPCIPSISDAPEFLLKFVQFPHYCSQAVLEGKPMC